MKIILQNFSETQEYNNVLSIMEKDINNIIDKKSYEKIILTEFFDVITAGTSADKSELLENDIPVYDVGRGGRYTYHGPGQRVIYPIINLDNHIWKKDLHMYLNFLHEWIIETLKSFRIKSIKHEKHIGVWIDNESGMQKIAAIGIRARKWVVYHGIAININTDISKFSKIVPCGISDLGVTSLKKLLLDISMEEFDHMLKKVFVNLMKEKFNEEIIFI